MYDFLVVNRHHGSKLLSFWKKSRFCNLATDRQTNRRTRPSHEAVLAVASGGLIRHACEVFLPPLWFKQRLLYASLPISDKCLNCTGGTGVWACCHLPSRTYSSRWRQRTRWVCPEIWQRYSRRFCLTLSGINGRSACTGQLAASSRPDSL